MARSAKLGSGNPGVLVAHDDGSGIEFQDALHDYAGMDERDDSNTAVSLSSRYERGMHQTGRHIERLAKLLDLPAAYYVAKSDVVAEAILVISQLSPRKQKQALALLK